MSVILELGVKFEVILWYIVSSRPAWAMCDSASKKIFFVLSELWFMSLLSP